MPKLAYRTPLPRPDDPELLQGIYDAVAYGIPLRYAAVEQGISEHTAYQWYEDGNRALAEHPDTHDFALASTPNETLPECRSEPGSRARFAWTVKEARAALARDRVGVVRAGGKDWAAAMTLLERVMPDDFGRRPATVTVDQRQVHVTVVALPGVSEPELLALVRDRLEAGQRMLPAPSEVTDP